MSSFPCGCCSYASDLLQRYLIEQYEFFTWYMSGEFGYGEDGESHAWLETQNHSTVIDITGDQQSTGSMLEMQIRAVISGRILWTPCGKSQKQKNLSKSIAEST